MTPPQRTVLILEIDEMTSKLYRRELGRRYQVVTCTTEHEAQTALHNQRVDAFVLEPTAFDDTEWTFVAQVRASAEYRAVPIIVCSTLDARRRGAELGVNAYLIKPVTPQTLYAVLQAQLDPAGTTMADPGVQS